MGTIRQSTWRHGGPPARSRRWAAVLGGVVAASLGTLATPAWGGSAASRCTPAAAIARWPVRRLAAQTIVVPVLESAVSAVTAEVREGAGGVVLFGSEAPATLPQAIRALVAAAPANTAPFVMADEEGGAVQRLPNLVGSLPSPRALGSVDTAATIRRLATGLGRRLRAAGVTMDLAPVADVDGGAGPNSRNPDGTRSFSPSVATAAADSVAFAEGLSAGGVVPVLKHFPGLGGASGNTDMTAATTLAWPTEKRVGLPPFLAGIRAHVPAIMVSNAVVPGLSTLPASLSPAVVTHELRSVLGYRGLVIADSLSAVAIRAAGFSVPAAAVASLRVGVDMLLYNPPATGSVAPLTDAVLTTIVGAVRTGTLTRSRLVGAATHVLAAKGALCGMGVG